MNERPKIAPLSDVTRRVDIALDAENQARAYDRKSMAMAFVLMVIRQRGDIVPNRFDMQNYDLFVTAGDNMAAPAAKAIEAPEEAGIRLIGDQTFNHMMTGISEGIKDLHKAAEPQP